MDDVVITKSREYTSRSHSTFSRLESSKRLLTQTLPSLGDKWDTHLPLFLEPPQYCEDAVVFQLI